MSGFISILSWAFALFMVLVTVLLALNRQTGLRLVQHRPDMLIQVLLVRYLSLSSLAIIAAWLNAPLMLSVILLSFAVVGLGDAFIYRRAGHPFWLHLASGVIAAIGALVALFAIP